MFVVKGFARVMRGREGLLFPPIRSVASTHWKQAFQTLDTMLPPIGSKTSSIALQCIVYSF